LAPYPLEVILQGRVPRNAISASDGPKSPFDVSFVYDLDLLNMMELSPSMSDLRSPPDVKWVAYFLGFLGAKINFLQSMACDMSRVRFFDMLILNVRSSTTLDSHSPIPVLLVAYILDFLGAKINFLQSMACDMSRVGFFYVPSPNLSFTCMTDTLSDHHM
jgi:hypothetical protein